MSERGLSRGWGRRASLALLIACAALGPAGVAWSHDFGGPTGNGGPPPGDGCPGCCGGGGGGGGGPCPPGGPGCGSSGNPVNYWDGSERHTTSDLRIGGVFPIEFQRIYDSRVDYDSPVGYGWSHSFDMRVFRFPDGTVMLRRTCGGRRLFTPSGGGFVSPAGEFLNTLEEVGDGTLRLVESTGTISSFDLNGRLSRIQDVHGNRLELEYDPAGRLPLQGTSRFSPDPSVAGVVALDYRLTAVRERDALGALTGRQITFTYDAASGRLEEVADHTGRTWIYAHDVRGNLISAAGPEGILSTYAYTDATDPHNLTSLTEPTAQFTLVYDTQDRVTRQTLGTGTVYDLTYTVPGTRTTVVKTVKDPGNVVTSTGTWVYEFNAYGNPTKVTDPLGNEITYGRDGEGNTTIKEVRENRPPTGLVLVETTAITYDANGNVLNEQHTQHSDGLVLTRIFTYDGNRVASEKWWTSDAPSDVHGYERTWAHNAGGFPTVVQQERRIVSGGGTPTPTFHVLNHTYNSFGQLQLTTYPNGDTDSYAYTNGYLTGLNGETYTRDARGNALTRVDRASQTWTYTYDGRDRLLTSRDPLGNEMRYTWTGDNLTQMEVGRNGVTPGRIFLLSYDAFGRMTQLRRETGGGPVTLVTRVLDSEGNVLRHTDGAGRLVRRVYDALGRMVSSTDAENEVTTYQYDVFGNPVKVTDPENRVTQYTYRIYDKPGKPLSVTNALGKTYTAVLDASGNLKSLTDPLSKALVETHDAIGRLTSFSTPSGATTSFSYNPRGLLQSRTDAGTGVTTYSYNPRGALTGVDLAGPDAVVLTLDLADRITRAVDSDSDLSFTYDIAGRLTQEKNNLTGRHVGYAYNSLNNRTSLTTSDGVTVAYDYDSLDRVSAIRRNGVLQVSYTRDNGGFVTRADYANGTYTTYGRDDMGRVTLQENRDAAHTLLHRISSTRDGTGVITVRHEEIRRPDGSMAERFHHYTYDPGLRLTREEIRAADDVTVLSARNFGYDDVGNRLSMTPDAGTATTYAYGTDYELLSETTGASSVTYTYDDRGNVLNEVTPSGTLNYSYDAENRLLGITGPGVSTAWSLSWDGRRLRETSGVGTTEFLYDGLNVLAEYPSAGQSTGYVLGISLDEIVAAVRGATTHVYAQVEDLRSVLQLTGPAGQVENAYVHQAFGESVEAVETVPNRFGFTGRDKDPSGHVHLRERAYSPRSGRFHSLDPYRPDATRATRIGNPQRFALASTGVQDSPLFALRRDINVNGMDVTGYEYVGNNPVNAIDPTGEVLIWNPASGSVTSGCYASGCFLSGCGGSGCVGSACGGSGCGGSACLGSGCGASGCGVSGCGVSGCGGSGCGGSGCLGSACAGSACVGSACFISVCGISGCIDSACGGSACLGSICGGSGCLGSICHMSSCGGSVCSESTCGGSACTASGCNQSAGCGQSGCSTSACNAASGCNSPCCS